MSLLAPALGAAQQTATVRGTVLGGGLPVPGITVTLLNPHGQLARQAETAEDGTWVLLVQIGDSPVRIQYYDPKGWYEAQWHPYAPDRHGAESLSLSAGETIELGTNLRLKPTARAIVRGRVTDDAGSPLTGIRVTLGHSQRDHYAALSARCAVESTAEPCLTDKNGEFVADVVDGDPVTLSFFDHSGVYEGEYYSDAPTLQTAQMLSLSPGETIEIEAALAPAPTGPGAPATIEGTVTDEAGNPVFETAVLVKNAACESIAQVGTDNAGRYVAEIGPLTDRVKLYFQSRWHEPEWHPDADDCATARTLALKPGATLEVDASLAKHAVIAGTVTDEDGQPLHGAEVVIYTSAGRTLVPVPTDEAGRFAIPLHSGDMPVAVRFSRQLVNAGEPVAEPEWYDDVPSQAPDFFHESAPDEAQRLSPSPGETIELHVALALPTTRATAVIQGTVTDEAGDPISDARVGIWSEDGRGLGQGVQGRLRTDAAGTYRAEVEADLGPVVISFNGDGHNYEFHDGAFDRADARRVPLSPGETIEIDASLVPEAALAGRVTDEGGRALEGIHVLVYQPWGDYQRAMTDADGRWVRLMDAQGGPFRVRFEDPSETLDSEWYDDTEQASARTIDVEPASRTEGIDATLGRRPVVSGTIANEDGEPLSGIDVLVFHMGTIWPANFTTASGKDGAYRVAVTREGFIRVAFSDPQGVYQTQYFREAAGRETAQVLTASPGETIEIDVTLAPAAEGPGADVGPGADAQADERVADAGGGRGGGGGGRGGGGAEAGGGKAAGKGGGGRAGAADPTGTGPGAGGAADGGATAGRPGEGDEEDRGAGEPDPVAGVTRVPCGDAVCPPGWRCEGERCLEPPEGGGPDPDTPIRPAPPRPRPPAPARRPPAGPPPDGRSWGDVHLRTFDGARYDFQAAGEFVGARSTAGVLEVQLRMQPLGNNDRVSVTTGVAARIEGDRVSIVAGRPPTLRVNGEPVRLERATQHELAGGGRIVAGDDLYVLVWPDESTLTVELHGAYLNAYLTPVPSRRGTLAGLFGNFDGEADNDFVTADGERLEPPLGFELVYGRLGTSWRIGQRESLFDYEPGQSTESFTVPGFPARSATVADLSAVDRRRAEPACRQAGVTDPAILEACIVDVGHSGDEGFALAAASAQVREGVPLAGVGRAASATLGPEPIVSGLCRPASAAVAAFSFRADAGRTARYPGALRRFDGEQRWSARGFRPGHDPLAVGDRVLAARERGLAALDAETGQIVWEVASPGGRIAGPGLLAAGGAVFAAWTDELAAYDLEAGTECWRLPVGPATSPAFADGRLFISVPEGESGYAAAVDAASGRIVWRHDGRHPSPANWPNPSAPTVGGGAVFVADGPEVVALDPASGEPRWRATTGGLVSASLAYADGVLYVPTRNRGLHALDAATGSPLWVWSNARGGVLHGSLALSDNLVFAVDERHLHAIERDSGDEAWTAEGTRLNLFHAPVLAGNRLYAITQDAALVVFDARHGTELHRIRTSERPAYGPATPTPGQRLLYFVLPDGKLYALR